eukprot:COSAG02_NODE_9116_length_2325_cov_0.962264_2_plen_88_part_00
MVGESSVDLRLAKKHPEVTMSTGVSVVCAVYEVCAMACFNSTSPRHVRYYSRGATFASATRVSRDTPQSALLCVLQQRPQLTDRPCR